MTITIERHKLDGLKQIVVDALFDNPIKLMSEEKELVTKLTQLRCPDGDLFVQLVERSEAQLTEIYSSGGISTGLLATLNREQRARKVVKTLSVSGDLLRSVFGTCESPEEARGAIRLYAEQLNSPGEEIMSWVDHNLVWSGDRWQVWGALKSEIDAGLTDRLKLMVDTAKLNGHGSVLQIDHEWRNVYRHMYSTMQKVVFGQ